MNTTDYERRLHACLDAHQDPLDDAELCAFLAEHEELLPAFAALRADLRALASAAPRRRLATVRLAAPKVAAVTALVSAAAGALLLLRAPHAPAAVPRPAARILAASLEELRPRAHVAASFTLHQTLLATPSTTFEVYETRSEVR